MLFSCGEAAAWQIWGRKLEAEYRLYDYQGKLAYILHFQDDTGILLVTPVGRAGSESDRQTISFAVTGIPGSPLVTSFENEYACYKCTLVTGRRMYLSLIVAVITIVNENSVNAHCLDIGQQIASIVRRARAQWTGAYGYIAIDHEGGTIIVSHQITKNNLLQITIQFNYITIVVYLRQAYDHLEQYEDYIKTRKSPSDRDGPDSASRSVGSFFRSLGFAFSAENQESGSIGRLQGAYSQHWGTRKTPVNSTDLSILAGLLGLTRGRLTFSIAD
ncbi:MAG: hypothetical protein ACR2PT_18555 [Endozoicomonas sp.]